MWTPSSRRTYRTCGRGSTARSSHGEVSNPHSASDSDRVCQLVLVHLTRELILNNADRGSAHERLWGCDMSVYKVVEIIGTSSESWEGAAMAAVTKARETIRQVRVAEVIEQDLDLDDGGGATFRTKLRLSFKYEDEK